MNNAAKVVAAACAAATLIGGFAGQAFAERAGQDYESKDLSLTQGEAALAQRTDDILAQRMQNGAKDKNLDATTLARLWNDLQSKGGKICVAAAQQVKALQSTLPAASQQEVEKKLQKYGKSISAQLNQHEGASNLDLVSFGISCAAPKQELTNAENDTLKEAQVIFALLQPAQQQTVNANFAKAYKKTVNDWNLAVNDAYNKLVKEPSISFKVKDDEQPQPITDVQPFDVSGLEFTQEENVLSSRAGEIITEKLKDNPEVTKQLLLEFQSDMDKLCVKTAQKAQSLKDAQDATPAALLGANDIQSSNAANFGDNAFCLSAPVKASEKKLIVNLKNIFPQLSVENQRALLQYFGKLYKQYSVKWNRRVNDVYACLVKEQPVNFKGFQSRYCVKSNDNQERKNSGKKNRNPKNRTNENQLEECKQKMALLGLEGCEPSSTGSGEGSGNLGGSGSFNGSGNSGGSSNSGSSNDGAPSDSLNLQQLNNETVSGDKGQGNASASQQKSDQHAAAATTLNESASVAKSLAVKRAQTTQVAKLAATGSNEMAVMLIAAVLMLASGAVLATRRFMSRV